MDKHWKKCLATLQLFSYLGLLHGYDLFSFCYGVVSAWQRITFAEKLWLPDLNHMTLPRQWSRIKSCHRGCDNCWNPHCRHIIYIWFRDFCLNTVAQYYTHKHPSVACQSWYALRLFLSIEHHRRTLISNKVLCSHRWLTGVYSMWCISCFLLAVGMFFLWGAQCLSLSLI